MEKIALTEFLNMPIPIEWKHIAVFIIMVLLIIDKMKSIPYKPVQNALRAFGRVINRDMLDKMDVVEKTLNIHIKEQDESESRRLRASIIAYANSIREGKHHTREQYENVFRDHDDYEKLCKKHGIKNGYLESEFCFVIEMYNEEYGTIPKVKNESEQIEDTLSAKHK